jgi:hypothetical protein
MRVIVTATILPALLISGCATKNYGRMQPLTGAERVAYTCRDIDLEIAKVQAFQQQVIEGAQFNMASVLGILGDYGIGNSMERSAADASAARRLGQLNDLKAERGCTGTSLTAADQRIVTASVANAPRASMSTDPADAPGTIDLGGGVKLVPSNSLSGYCIKAQSGYMGTGAVNRPAVTSARPRCS